MILDLFAKLKCQTLEYFGAGWHCRRRACAVSIDTALSPSQTWHRRMTQRQLCSWRGVAGLQNRPFKSIWIY